MKAETKYNSIKAGVWYAVGNILIKGIPFLTLPIFTDLLTTDDFGIYNTYVSYESILGILIGLGISGSIKVAKIDFKENFEKYVSSVIRLQLFAGGICLIAANAVSPLLYAGGTWITPLILNLMVIQSVSTALYGIIGSKYVIDGKYVQNILISFIMTGANIGFSLLLCFCFSQNNRAAARIIGTAMGGIVAALYILISQRKKAKFKRYEEADKYALRLGIPLIPHQLSITLLSQCDKIMIQSMVSNSAAGIYGLAVTIASIMSVILTSIDNAWTPWFYSKLNKKEYRILKNKNNLLIVFFMYLTCGFLLIGPEIIHIMSARSYWDSIYTFIPLTISVFFNFMYIFFVGVEYFMKKTGYISAATIICAAVNLVLNYILIKSYGYMAAAYATCISKLMLFILHYIRGKKLLKTDTVVNIKVLIINMAIVCIVGIFTGFFIDSIALRYGLILMLTIVVLIYSKEKFQLSEIKGENK